MLRPHLSGISLAISASACDTGFAAIEAARAAGVRVSFDTNLRLKPALAAALSTEGYGAVEPIPRADVVRARLAAISAAAPRSA